MCLISLYNDMHPNSGITRRTQDLRTKYLHNGRNANAFTTLRRIIKITSSASFGEFSLPTCEWDDSYACCTVKGKAVVIDKIAAMYSATLDDAQSFYDELVGTMNNAFPDYLKPSQLPDNKGNTEYLYGFLNSGTPGLESLRDRLLTHIYQDQGSNCYVTGFSGTKAGRQAPIFHLGKMEVFMSTARKLNDLILVLMHVGGGQPARASEILTMTYRNGQNFPRSLFISEGTLSWVLRHNKVCLSYPILTQCITYH